MGGLLSRMLQGLGLGMKEISMTEAVIVTACRTAIGTSHRGSLVDVSPFELARVVVAESVERAGVAPELFEEVAMGEVLYGGGVIARNAAIEAGLTNAASYAVNRQCASGLTAIEHSAAHIKSGMMQLAIAGGAHAASSRPTLRRRVLGTADVIEDWVSPSHPPQDDAPNNDMTITVGWNTAKIMGISREDLDAWAYRSHQKAIASIDAGHFAEEIVPIKVTRRDGSVERFEVDEHPRRETTLKRLAELRVIHPEIDGFNITAGNSSGVNDAAAAVTIASDSFAAEHGLATLAVIRSWASVGVNPAETGMAPILAIPKALKLAGISVRDVDLWEINEAFASTPIAAARSLDIDPELINVNGSGCSLGHPVAATGARMVSTMIYELRRRGGGTGVVSMCAGGGLGSAAVIEVPAP